LRFSFKFDLRSRVPEQAFDRIGIPARFCLERTSIPFQFDDCFRSDPGPHITGFHMVTGCLDKPCGSWRADFSHCVCAHVANPAVSSEVWSIHIKGRAAERAGGASQPPSVIIQSCCGLRLIGSAGLKMIQRTSEKAIGSFRPLRTNRFGQVRIAGTSPHEGFESKPVRQRGRSPACRRL